MSLLTIYYEYNVKCDDNSNEDFLHFSSFSRRGHASARKILVALGTEKQARKMIKDTELVGKIPAPLSLGSLDAACAGFFWISHRLNCVPLPTLFFPFLFPFFFFEECLANGWQLVPSRTQYRGAIFCNGEVKLEDEKSSMPLLHRRCNGASRFQAVPPSCTLRYGTSTSRPSAIAFPVSPFVHAACYFFLPLSEHASHPDNARYVPFSTTRTKTAVDAALYRCYPTASNSIHRHSPPREG